MWGRCGREWRGGVGLKLEDLKWVWNLGFVLDHDLHRGIDE